MRRTRGFGTYDVVPDGTRDMPPDMSPDSNRVTETEFRQLGQAWHNITHNVGMTMQAQNSASATMSGNRSIQRVQP